MSFDIHHLKQMILQIHTEMKKFIITPVLALLVTAGTALTAQDNTEYLGLPGDNLNLYAVMNLFQESPTLEDFERNLNDANSRINNLDLNGDNLVDYITVNDYIDGNVHNIVLRTALNRLENQDLAVFTVQKFRNGTVQIQLIGDEALYGRNYIVEPVDDDNYAGTYNPGYTGNGRVSVNVNIVADWPLVRYIYYPGYTTWHSSWYWGYYPSYWNPWRPYYWHYYYGYHYNDYRDYYRFYRRYNHNRYDRYNDFYYGRIRSHSPMVDRRIREGHYSSTYSRPEMRREGEAQYSRVYAERRQAPSVTSPASVRRSNTTQRPDQAVQNRSTSGTTASRRSVTQSSTPAVQNRTASRTTTAQRPATTQRSIPSSVQNRSASRPEAVQRPATSQRSTPAVQNRSVSRPEAVQRPATSQRSTPAVQNRSVSRPESVQRPATSQRSTPAVQNRSVSRPESVQRPATSQRSTPAVQNRSVSRPEAVQRPATSQRSAPAASGRSSAAPQSSPRRESVSSSRPSAPTARASSAPSRSSGPSSGTRSSSSSSRSSSKESGSSQSSRRN
jgi:hypothetical protein